MKRLLSVLSALLLLLGVFLFSRTADIGANLRLFNTGFLLASAGYLGLLCWGLPLRGRGWYPVLIALVLVPRLFALHLVPSSDMARYAWEGRILCQGYNPFSVAPDDPALIPYRDDVYPGINHKDMPAIYPPLTQAVFALLSMFTPSIEGFRLFMLVVEFLVLAVLYGWIRSLGLPRERVLIYALNPLVVIAIAGHGHLEAMQALLMLLCFVCLSRKREGMGMVFLTLAGMVKFLALFALPFLVKRKTLKFVPLCLGIIGIGYLPFFFLEGSFSFGSLLPFFTRLEYYSLTYAPLRWLLGTNGAFVVTASVLLVLLAGLWLTRTRAEQAVPAFLLALILMSPTVHYWYVVPILALGTVWRSRALIALSLLFLPYFDVMQRLSFEGVFEGAWWRPVATYLPFLVILWLEMSGRWPAFRVRITSIGFVVPVLDDADSLKTLLGSMEGAGVHPEQVVVADGGSRDESVEVATKWGSRVVACPRPGRGYQIARGARGLKSEITLILHADNVVPPDMIQAVCKAASAYPDAAGGAFRLRYSRSGFRMRLLSFFSNAKASLFGVSFGDQGQWFRTGSVAIPEIPLMEDVEMAVRLNDRGSPVRIPARLAVSTRRYTEKGRLRVILSVIAYTAGYLFQRRWNDAVPDTTDLYRRYYGDKAESMSTEPVS